MPPRVLVPGPKPCWDNDPKNLEGKKRNKQVLLIDCTITRVIWTCLVTNKINTKCRTLFPDRVLPVKSSLLINNENSFGRFEIFHGWIGVLR